MANNIFQAKRTNVSGRTPNTTGSYVTNSQYIAAGEFALNMADGILYSSNGSAVITVGSNLVNQKITNSFTIDNNKAVRFTTVNASAVSYFIQQNDDNFVFYSTNTAYGTRPIWSVYANSITSNLQIQIPLQPLLGLVANGSIGSPGQLLASNGSSTYWTTVSGTGTVTSVDSANGIAGGPITGSGTLYVVAGNSTVFVNASGVHVNTSAIPAAVNVDAQYTWTNTQTFTNTITFNSTINATSNNASNFNGQPASYYTNASNITTGTLPWAQAPTGTVNTSGNFTLSGNTTLSGTNTTVSSNLNVTGSFLNVASAFVVNSTGAYHTGTVNAASHTVGTSTIANSTGVYAGVVNATTHSSGATFTANSTLVNAAAINVTGQVNTSTFYATSANIVSKIQLGTPTAFSFGANAIIEIDANQNTYTQIVVQNANTGNNASSDLVVTADTGNDSVDYIDLGINNSLYNQPLYNIIGAKDGYLYASNGALAIGTLTAKEVILHANGATSTDRKLTVNATAITIANSVTLVANGSAGVAGYVLTSNGATGSPYWSQAAGGGSVYLKGGASTIGSLATEGQNIFRVNANTLNNDTTIATGENAQATGPLSVASGKTLTIQTGARVAIV